MYSPQSKKETRIVFLGLGNHGFTLLAFFVCVIAGHRVSLVIDPSPKSKKLADEIKNKTEGFEFLANINTSNILRWKANDLKPQNNK